jgi:chitinase
VEKRKKRDEKPLHDEQIIATTDPVHQHFTVNWEMGPFHQHLNFLIIFAVLCTISVTASNFTVFGYLPEWRYEGANFNTIFSHVTHLIFFSAEPSPDGRGEISGIDRIPAIDILNEAKASARSHGGKLLLCFGGNGRSAGFSTTTKNKKSRDSFVSNVVELLKIHDFDGLDLNWEYPGYSFQRGYDNKAVDKEYDRFLELVKSLRARLGNSKVITMAYYPDGRQEQYLVHRKFADYIDYFHMMTYDQNGGHHSTFELSERSIQQGISIGLPAKKLTVGLPFYGRHSKSGDWTTYEDLVQKHALSPEIDEVVVQGGITYFNGINTIQAKTKYALSRKIGGVMIWVHFVLH